MNIITIFFISISLACDAFAASISIGVCKKQNLSTCIFTAFSFGFFQGFMFFLGWLCCLYFQTSISDYSHWISFFLLTTIGINMFMHSNCNDFKEVPITLLSLISISIATSIDALASGVSFSILSISILEPILIITIVTFLLCFIGILLGKKLKYIISDTTKIYYLSGIILIAIALKILLESI